MFSAIFAVGIRGQDLKEWELRPVESKAMSIGSSLVSKFGPDRDEHVPRPPAACKLVAIYPWSAHRGGLPRREGEIDYIPPIRSGDLFRSERSWLASHLHLEIAISATMEDCGERQRGRCVWYDHVAIHVRAMDQRSCRRGRFASRAGRCDV